MDITMMTMYICDTHIIYIHSNIYIHITRCPFVFLVFVLFGRFSLPDSKRLVSLLSIPAGLPWGVEMQLERAQHQLTANRDTLHLQLEGGGTATIHTPSLASLPCLPPLPP